MQAFLILLSHYAPMPRFSYTSIPWAVCVPPRDGTVSSSLEGFLGPGGEPSGWRAAFHPAAFSFTPFHRDILTHDSQRSILTAVPAVPPFKLEFVDGVCPGWCEVHWKDCSDRWLLEDIIDWISSISRPVRHGCSFNLQPLNEENKNLQRAWQATKWLGFLSIKPSLCFFPSDWEREEPRPKEHFLQRKAALL